MWMRIGVGPEEEPPEAAADVLPVVAEATPLACLDSPALAVTLEERCCGCAKDCCVEGSDAEEEN
jgi:hypothetical protein